VHPQEQQNSQVDSNKHEKKKLTTKLTAKDKEPQISIMSLDLLGGDNDFDYFPHMKWSEKLKTLENDLVGQVKRGTYQIFNQAVEYTAVVKKDKNHTLVSAKPKSDEYEASKHSIYEADMVEQQTRAPGKTRYEVLNEQFQRSNIPLRPRYYHNPLQYFDHVVLADGYVNSFGGTVVDTYVDFVMPKMIKPVLKLRNPKNVGDKKAQEKKIKESQEIIDKLEAIDMWYSDKGRSESDPLMDIPFQQKIKSIDYK